MSINPDCVDLHAGDPEEAAQIGLYALMAGISEECWCAGWETGLEFDLWDAIGRFGKPYGQGTVTVRQARLLRDLAEECNGWWTRDENHEPEFVSLDVWRRRVATTTRKITA